MLREQARDAAEKIYRYALEALKRRAANIAALHALFPELGRYGIPECSDRAYLKGRVTALRQELADTRRLASETQARFRALQANHEVLHARIADLEAAKK